MSFRDSLQHQIEKATNQMVANQKTILLFVISICSLFLNNKETKTILCFHACTQDKIETFQPLLPHLLL